MDPARLYNLLTAVRQAGLAADELPGLLHILIGRRVTFQDSAPVSEGMTWREAADVLTLAGWEPSGGPGPVRRRWFSAIRLARVDSPEAREAADRLAEWLGGLGYVVGPGPSEGKRPPRPRKGK